MKKSLFLFLLPLLLLLGGCVNESPEPLYTPPTISAEDRERVRTTELNGIYYSLYNDYTCEITEADPELYDTSSLTLPDTISGYTVIAIEEEVFQNAAFTSVVLPSTLEYIGDRAFEHSQLTSLSLPDSLRTMGEEAFANCVRLEEITLPAGLGSVPVGAFYGCRSLARVELEEGIHTIGEEAFGDIPALEEVILPESLRHIGDYAFWRCGGEALEFAIPEGVETVGTAAFRETHWWKNLTEEWTLVGQGVLLRYNGTDPAPVLPEEARYLSSAFDGTAVESLTLPTTLLGASEDALAESAVKTVSYDGDVPSLVALKK